MPVLDVGRYAYQIGTPSRHPSPQEKRACGRWVRVVTPKNVTIPVK